MEKQSRPVLLVHGLIDTDRVFNKMNKYLTGLGWEVHSLNLIPNYGIESLVTLADQVKDYIDNKMSHHKNIDLIGFSMGGVVTRYYLQRLGGVDKVKRYISISAPNNGTLMAHLLPIKGVVEMRPDSYLLKDLNSDYQELLEKINFHILWTNFDFMIIPPSNSQMNEVNDTQIPVLIHRWMLSDRRVLNKIKELLLEPIRK